MRLALALLSAAILGGCDCTGEVPADGGPDAPVPAADGGMDGGTRDVGTDAARDGGPRTCTNDLECPAGLLCLGGFCQIDPCASDNPCADGERCRGVCVALSDPCEGVSCAADETCIDGTCFAGCLPVACEGVDCPAGQFCDPSRGTCIDIVPCDALCGDGAACHTTCTPRSACEGVTCAEGEFCRAGSCLPTPASA